MFRDPLLHLDAGLFPGQRASLDLRPGGLAQLGELLGEGCLFRRRVGTGAGTESGTGTELHPGTLATLESAELPRAASGHHLPTAGSGEAGSAANAHRTAHRGAALQGATLQGTSLQGTTLQGTTLQGAALQGAALQAADLTDPLRTRHREAAQLEALDLARLEAGNVVDSS